MTEARRDRPSRDGGRRYLVLASLPHLPRFDRARQLPIGRETLASRLALLARHDADEIALAASFLSWQHHGVESTDEEVIREFDRVMAAVRSDGLRRLVAFRLGLRTLVAGVRHRRRADTVARRGERWGVGPWAGYVVRRYGDPDFGLEHVLPWLPRARSLLEDDDAVALERLLFELVWRELDRLTAADPFGIDAVIAYVFKWDLVDRWLRQDPATAAQRLDALAQDALGEYARPFAQIA